MQDSKKAKEIIDNHEKLSNFWINVESNEFGSLLEDIHERYLYIFEFGKEKESESKFYDLIQKNFVEMQKCCTEE